MRTSRDEAGSNVPLAGSTTHQHLLSVLATELPRFEPEPIVRVLDAGCGDGELISYLVCALPAVFAGAQVELYGFDVTDHGLQPAEFLHAAIRLLSSRHPRIRWESRIRSIASDEPWPFADGSFHVVISNQVIEHVRNHDLFMSETARVLGPGGFAVHVFPSKACLWEPHLHLPVAHWITNHKWLAAYITFWSRVGVGKYRAHARETGVSVEAYAQQHADYLSSLTNYKSRSILFNLARAHGLAPSSRYIEQYYIQKIRRMRGQPPLPRYRKSRMIFHALGRRVLPLIASTTLFLEKRDVA